MVMNKAGDAVMLTSGASGRINALISLRALRSLWLLINAFFLIFLLPFRGRRRSVVVAVAEENSKASSSAGKVVRVPAAMVPRNKNNNNNNKEVAARRALAIKRVLEDDCDDAIREYSTFVTNRGDTIFTQSWTPVKANVRGLVILLHGLNEHSGRYSDFARKLNANGFKVYGMDWIGHEYISVRMPSLAL